MTRNDTTHQVAEIIKNLEERIANLEEQDRSTTTPNLLRTQRDRVVVSDAATTVSSQELHTAHWRPINERPGWASSTWGAYE